MIATSPQDCIQQAATVSQLPCQADIVQHGQIGEQSNVLKRPRNPCRCDFMRLAAPKLSRPESDLTAVRPINAGEQIKDGCLAGPVGTD